MMTPQMIEGTWEEIVARHPELCGRRVRLIVLPEDETQRADTGADLLSFLIEIGFVGQWADRTDIPDSPEYVRLIRAQAENRENDAGSGH
ncbi:MAG: hypothetical protein K6U77_07560 [Armatimonadetes bacterium]|nr:hypothetical protein [Armatimonadota bacterium]